MCWHAGEVDTGGVTHFPCSVHILHEISCVKYVLNMGNAAVVDFHVHFTSHLIPQVGCEINADDNPWKCICAGGVDTVVAAVWR